MSGRGILLEVAQCSAKLGDTVVLRSGKHRGRFEVTRISALENSVWHVGLEHALPTTLFWGLKLPAAGPDPYFHERQESRRQARRSTTELSVEVRIKANVPIWSTTANVSEGGCFIYMLNGLALFTKVDVALWIGAAKFWTESMVVSSINGEGIGVKFLKITDEARERLREAIANSPEVEDRRYMEENSPSEPEIEVYVGEMRYSAIGRG
jgi:hypothetical protein